jgi:hypothetical protein
MNILRIDIDTEVLATGAFGAGALVRVERATAEAGVYAELGTVAVVAGQSTGTYYDEAGTTAHWYRVRYSNAGNTKQSEYSAPWQAVSVGYTSLADVKARLGMGTVAGTADAIMSTIVAEVNSWLDGRLGRHVGPGGSATRTYDGDGSGLLYVRDGVQAVYSLTLYDGTRGASTSIAATDYYLDPLPHLRRPGEPAFYVTMSPNPAGSYSRFPVGKRTVEVTGLWGWPAVPLELQAVATKCAVADWRGRASAGGDQFTIGVNGERTYERYLSYEDRKTIERYAVELPGVS